MKIKLNNIDDAIKIASMANKYKQCDINAKIGRYIIDLKSVLGILSFGVPNELDVTVIGTDTEAQNFYEEIDYWRV